MQYIKHIIVLCSIIMFATSASAQSTDLNFSLQSSSIQMDGESTPIGSIMTKEGNQFVWSQQIGENESVSTYNIVNKLENWDKNNSSGSIEYTLEINEFESVLTITGDDSSVSVTLSSINANGQIETLSFNISNVTYN